VLLAAAEELVKLSQDTPGLAGRGASLISTGNTSQVLSYVTTLLLAGPIDLADTSCVPFVGSNAVACGSAQAR
jgi:hypothetical protein